MKRKIISMITAMSLLLAAVPAMAAEDVTVIRLDPSNASPFNNGEFQGWGTSLCWWANRLGYSEKLTEQAAKAFFGEEGLGLDIARYNLGGGDNPEHNHITRSDSKVPSYAVGFDENENIIYDWTADENQRNIALAALKANPDLYFEGFSNSPPYFMTNSGCSSGAENAGDDNLNPRYYDKFGEFIAEVTKHLGEEYGIKFQSYSPMNEPDTTYWGAYSPKQEGAHYTPGETQSNTIIATRKALDNAGLTDVLVAGMDETDIDKSVKNYTLLTDEAKAALGRIDTHTYGGSQRRQLKETAVNAGKDLWMSEVDGGWDGFGLANRIILDMNGMQPAAWVMWDIVDFHRDSKFTTPDGTRSEAEAVLNPQNGLWGVAMADHDTESLELSNKYYFYGQFTRYINPGDTIIASSRGTLAAYNKVSGDIKIVAINQGTADADCVFDLTPFTAVGDTVTEIRTNNEIGENAEHWKEISGEAKIKDKKLTATLKAGTLTTFVIHGETDDHFTFNPTTGEYSYSDAVAARSKGERVALYDENGVLQAVKTSGTSGRFDNSKEGYTAKLFADNDIYYVMPEKTEDEKYENASYKLVSNVKDATNDFEKDAGAFNLGGTAALTVDGEGNNVLGVQAEYINKDGEEAHGSAELDLNNLTCNDSQTINISFDIYASNSGGVADFALLGEKDTEIVKLHYRDWDAYDMTVGGRFFAEDGAAKIYLRNYVNDKRENQLIANGAHIEIYYTPSTGKVRVTVKNNTNYEETLVYEGTARNAGALTRLIFSADYTNWAKPMYIDNLTTNILEE